MKRCLLLLIILVFLPLTGCSAAKESRRDSVQFYYCSDSSSFQIGQSYLAPEVRSEGLTGINDVQLWNCYLAGPVTEGFFSPFPDSACVLNVTYEDDCVVLTLSDAYFKLAGAKQTLANACLCTTVLTHTQKSSLVIRSGGNSAEDSTEIILTADMFAVCDPDSGYGN